MVHTRWGVGQLRTAEVRRGCIFSEELSSVDGVIRNGGTIGSGAKFVSPQEGFFFNGSTTAKINFGDILRIPKTATTMSCWFKCDNSVVTEMMLFGQNDAFGTRIHITNGVLTFYLIIGVAARIVNATGTWNDGQWHHVVGTWSSGDYVKIYVDGKYNSATASTYTGVCSTNTGYSDFTINSTILANKFFKGNLRGVKVFSTALDTDEIAAYYNNSMFSYMDYCIQLLPMRIQDHDIANARTLDRSGNNNHAQLGNGSTTTTFPTKLSDRPGYYFDGGDHMVTTILPVATQSIYCLFSRRVAVPATCTYFGCYNSVSGRYQALYDFTTTGTLKWYSGALVYTGPEMRGQQMISACCRTTGGNKHWLLLDGVTEGKSTSATNLNTTEAMYIGAMNNTGVAQNKITGNIYSYAVFNNIFLNTMQAIDLDIRMKECASRGC